MQQLNENVKNKQVYPEKVLQFGEGNFMRAFVDWKIDLLNQKTDFNGSVVVVQPIEHGLVNRLNEQDGLYTLYLQGIKNGEAIKEHSVIQSISRGLDLMTDYDEYLKVAENPELRFIFSNTTEAGIAYDESDQLTDKPQKTFPGKLTAFLYHRYQTFQGDPNKGFILIPCELIEQNGQKLKEIVLRYAEQWDLGADFINWIHEGNTFCNSLVDRIVPGYPKDTIEEITEELGYRDELVVVGEQYHLWVIEGPEWIQDEFPVDQTGLNVLFVEDLTPYRTMKVRILNGAHTAMTPVAYLYGLETVREAIEHDVTGQFVNDLIEQEIIPILDLPSDETKKFANDVIERFLNPFVKHYLMDISLNSISKYQTRNLPSLLDYVNQKHALPKRIVFSLAALLLFYEGRRGEEIIQISDDEHILECFQKQWSTYDGSKESIMNIVTNILDKQTYWGQNLNEVPGLRDLVADYLFEIKTKGIQNAIKIFK